MLSLCNHSSQFELLSTKLSHLHTQRLVLRFLFVIFQLLSHNSLLLLLLQLLFYLRSLLFLRQLVPLKLKNDLLQIRYFVFGVISLLRSRIWGLFPYLIDLKRVRCFEFNNRKFEPIYLVLSLFEFDCFLFKPCLVVLQHDFCLLLCVPLFQF